MQNWLLIYEEVTFHSNWMKTLSFKEPYSVLFHLRWFVILATWDQMSKISKECNQEVKYFCFGFNLRKNVLCKCIWLIRALLQLILCKDTGNSLKPTEDFLFLVCIKKTIGRWRASGCFKLFQSMSEDINESQKATDVIMWQWVLFCYFRWDF